MPTLDRDSPQAGGLTPRSGRTRVYLLVQHAFGHGGVPRTTLRLAGRLAGRGYDVEVISLLRRRSESFFPVDERVAVSVLEDQHTPNGNRPARNNPERRLVSRLLDRRPSRLFDDEGATVQSLLTDLKLRRKLKSLKPGIVIATRPPLTLAVARWAPPHVVKLAQEHIGFEGRTAAERSTVSRSAHGLDALLTLTEKDKRAWSDALGGTGTLVEAIPNASPFAAGQPSSLNSKMVLAAGRLSSQKGFDRLIPAFGPIAQDHPDWQLHIYGKGADQRKLRQLIRAEQLQHNVFLKGLSNELEEVFAQASIFAMSSRYEGLPMVLLEAMSKGVPLVSFDCPEGPRQLITHEENGLLVPNGDIPALTAALRALVEDHERRTRLGAGALKAAQQYDADAITDRWEALFEELLRHRRSPQREPQEHEPSAAAER